MPKIIWESEQPSPNHLRIVEDDAGELIIEGTGDRDAMGVERWGTEHAGGVQTIRALLDELKRLRLWIKGCELRVATYEETQATLAKQLEDLKIVELNLRGQLAEVQSTADTTAGHLHDMELRAEELERERLKAEHAHEETKAEGVILQGKVTEQEGIIAECAKAVEDMTALVNEQTEAVKARNAEINEQKQQIEARDAQIAEQKQKLEELNKEIESDWMVKVKEQVERIMDQEKQIKELEAELHALESAAPPPNWAVPDDEDPPPEAA